MSGQAVIVGTNHPAVRNAVCRAMVDELHGSWSDRERIPPGHLAAGRLGRATVEGFFSW